MRKQWQDWGSASRLPAVSGPISRQLRVTRALSHQCTNKAPKIRPDRERVADAKAARDWLQQQSFIREDRISLLGWANGGRRNAVGCPSKSGAR